MVYFIQQRFFHKDIFENKKRNILIVSVFDINENKYNYIKNYQGEKGLYITEPIQNLSCKKDHYYWVYKLYIENQFDYIFGCIENNNLNHFKYPLYLNENHFNIKNKEIYNEINHYVNHINIEKINKKKFCCLINSWDTNQKTRTIMFETLNNIEHINCPGKLFNNCSNQTLNKIGKANYIRGFIFNICSENFDNHNISGYITEKLMDCCLGGAIPIYSGWLDEYDLQIFNKKRIIFYNSKDKHSIENAYSFINELLNDSNKLCRFYNQPIFNEKAFETITNLNIKLNTFLNIDKPKIKTIIICNKKKEPERYDFLMKQIKILGLNTFLDIHFLDNLTWGNELTISMIKKICKTDYSMIKHGRSMKIKPLNRGEISLFLNYMKCLKYANENWNEDCLLLESDVIFKKNTRIKLEKIIKYSREIKDWNIINIGEGHKDYMKSLGYPKSCPLNIHEYTFYKENINRCAEAIYWNQHSIQTILDVFHKYQDVNGPIDTYLDVFSNNPTNQFNIYWSEDTIVQQGSIHKHFKSHLR